MKVIFITDDGAEKGWHEIAQDFVDALSDPGRSCLVQPIKGGFVFLIDVPALVSDSEKG